MVSEADAEHVKDFPLQPIGDLPEVRDGVHGLPVVDLGLDPEAAVIGERIQMVDDVKPGSPLGPVDGRQVHQEIEPKPGVVPQKLQNGMDLFLPDDDRFVPPKGVGLDDCSPKAFLENRQDRTAHASLSFLLGSTSERMDADPMCGLFKDRYLVSGPRCQVPDAV
jgi:hypothetical protein